MEKRKICAILFFLIPLLIAIPPVYSAPTVTVTHPNGGENLTNNVTLQWNVSSIERSQQLESLLFYSMLPSLQETQIADLNVFEYCEAEIAGVEWVSDPDFNNNFGVIFHESQVSQGSFLLTAGDSVLNYFSANYDAVPDSIIPFAVTWDGSSWDLNGDINQGIINYSGVSGAVSPIEIFEMGGTTYMLQYVRTGAASSVLNGYSWNGSLWVVNYDINSGFPDNLFNTSGKDRIASAFSVVNHTFFSKDFWIIAPVYNNSWYWDDSATEWVAFDYLGHDLNSIEGLIALNTDGFEAFSFEDRLIATYRPSTLPQIFIEFIDGDWQIADLNSGILKTGNSTQAKNSFIEFEGKDYLLSHDSAIPSYFYRLTSGEFSSDEIMECEFDWDISSVDNGLYFFDVNVVDFSGDTNISTLDSSNNPFRILNWTNEDIACECVSNCSSCTLDVNAFVIIPSNQISDTQIKITNGVGIKNVGYRIINSNNSGKQYKIFTASQNDFDNGIWNLSDTLTYGATTSDPVQKIWQPDSENYRYFFDDLIASENINYFKFNYFEPQIHFFTVEDPVWDNQLPPNVLDFNELTADLFQISTFSDLASILTDPELPSITSNESNKNYVFEFTAKSDSAASGELAAGIVPNRSVAAPTSIDLLIDYRTFAFSDIGGGFVKFQSTASTSREFIFQNYVIVERGFFTKPIEILDKDGSQLSVLIGDSNKVSKYVLEGKEFLVKSQYFDEDGVIDSFEITAFIDSITTPANRIKRWTFDVSDKEGLVNISEKIDGLIDLTASAPDRTVILTLRLIDEKSNYYEIQSDSFTLRQFPKDTKDIYFNIREDNKKIGDHPKGRITLETIAPENIIGVELNIKDSVDNNNADFNTIFYKDQDFSCNAFDCSFDYEIEEYIFPTSDIYKIEAWVLVTTEEKDPDTFGLLHKLLMINVSWITFDTARIFQVNERSDHIYRNDEIIPLTVQLRDSTGQNLKNKVHVKMQLSECNADANVGGACRDIDLNYLYDSHLYDLSTGYNYYFFKQLFVEEDFTRLSDLNYFRFKALIEDPTKTHQILYQPVLADKCQQPNILLFFANLLTMNFFNSGCNTEQFTNEIVALPDNNTQEERIWIHKDHATTAPTQFWFMCSEPDQNNLYSDVLAQDIICWTWYLLGEQPIDKFKLTIANKNSDLSETEEKFKQFIETEVPFEIIYTNDLTLMKQAMEKNFQTDSIDTVGEMIQLQADYLLGALTPTINIAGNSLIASGIIDNVGFEMGATEAGNTVDFNFNTPLNPNTISGVLLYRIRNMNVVNKKDYETAFPQVKSITPKRFAEFAESENIPIQSEDIQIDVFVSDMVKIISEESEAILVIDEETNPNNINIANADTNRAIQFQTTPTKLRFQVVSDMIFNNEKSFKRRYIVLPYSLIIEIKTFCGLLGINCLLSTEPGTIPAIFLQGDLSFFVVNWSILLAVMIGVLFVSIVIGNIKGKGIQIRLPGRKEG